MVVLMAPVPILTSTLFLPKARLLDSRGLVVSVNRKRAMDGTLYSTVLTTGFEKLELAFELTRLKSVEFEEFYDNHVGNQIRLTNYDNKIYHGYITNDIKIEAVARGEYYSLTLEFEGKLQ